MGVSQKQAQPIEPGPSPPRGHWFLPTGPGLVPVIVPVPLSCPVLPPRSPWAWASVYPGHPIHHPGPREGSSERLYVGIRNLGSLCPAPQVSCQTVGGGRPSLQHPAKATGPLMAPSRPLGAGQARDGIPSPGHRAAAVFTYREGRGDPGVLGHRPAPCPRRQKPAVSLHLREE